MDRNLSRALLVLSALPFVALPMGSNTNLPMSSVVAVVLTARCAKYMPVMWTALLVAGVPFFAAAARMFVSPEPWQVASSVTWVVFTLPFAGTAAAVVFLRYRAISWLSWTMLLSAAFALVQKYVFFDILNTVPFESFYDLPGYANVSQYAETFLTYVGRPFGMFPETSFMVGSLSLMAMGLVILIRHYNRRVNLRDGVSLTLVLWAVAISGSGSAVVVLGVVLIAAIAPYAGRNAWATIVLVPAGLAGAVVVSIGTLRDRSETFNWSWSDRYSSIAASMRYWLSDPLVFLWGVGRGNTNEIFLNHRMPLGDLKYYTPLPDIYSVTGRVILESGAVFGLGLVLVMVVLILRAGSRNPQWLGLCSLIVWAVVSGLTISYDSAFWIWGLAGMCLGLELTRGWPDPAPFRPAPWDSEQVTTSSERSSHARASHSQ